MQIFTAGYSGHPPRSLVLAARELGAQVLDIRHTPFSKIPGYNKADLQSALDARYEHVPALGNVNHAGSGDIQLANPDLGIPLVLRRAHCAPVVLLCGCKDFHCCHRRTVSVLLAKQGVQTQELVWPMVPRLNLEDLSDTALSIKEPWCWFITRPDLVDAAQRAEAWRNYRIKDVENRSWGTRFRGRFLIHASKSYDFDNHVYLVKQNLRRGELAGAYPKHSDLDLGGIVGMATLTDCVTESDSPWFCGEYGFVLEDAMPLDFMALRGSRGFFSVREQLEAMKASAQKQPKQPASKPEPRRKESGQLALV